MKKTMLFLVALICLLSGFLLGFVFGRYHTKICFTTFIDGKNVCGMCFANVDQAIHYLTDDGGVEWVVESKEEICGKKFRFVSR